MKEQTVLERLREYVGIPSTGDTVAFKALEATVFEFHEDGNHLAAGFGWEQGRQVAAGGIHPP